MQLKITQQETQVGQMLEYQAAVGAALVSVLVSGLFVDYLEAEAQIWFITLLAVLVNLPRRLLSESAVQGTPDGRISKAIT
jgi:hypothetical protein